MRTSVERKFKKIPNRSYNQTEKYTRGVQRQTGWGRGMNQWARRQSNGTHPDRAVKWKQNLKQWRCSEGPLGQHQAEY